MGPENYTREIITIHEDFELYQVFIYELFAKIIKVIETLWSRDVTDIQVLTHSASKVHKDFLAISVLCELNCFKYFLIYILGAKTRHEKFWTISSLYELNCFKYFLIYIVEHNVLKNSERTRYL